MSMREGVRKKKLSGVMSVASLVAISWSLTNISVHMEEPVSTSALNVTSQHGTDKKSPGTCVFTQERNHINVRSAAIPVLNLLASRYARP